MKRQDAHTIAECLGVAVLAAVTAAVLSLDGLSSRVADVLMHGLCAVGEVEACELHTGR